MLARSFIKVASLQMYRSRLSWNNGIHDRLLVYPFDILICLRTTLFHIFRGLFFSTKAIGAEYLVFVSSRSLKTREKYTNWDNLVCLSLYIFWAQSHLCLLLQKKVFCKNKHEWFCALKIYKLRQTKLSQLVYFLSF